MLKKNNYTINYTINYIYNYTINYIIISACILILLGSGDYNLKVLKTSCL